SKNELAQVLDLLAFQQPGGNEPMRNGLALRRVLDQGIDAIVGPDVRGWQGMGKWRLENYLHLRYREKRQHRDIAIQMGYTERHLQRLKQELLLEVSEILLALTHGPEPAQGLSSISNRRSGERPPI
ncbi:MAG: hypothetical protein GY759_06945, partial [Chloroflexi bacterium]|nr:hypothetical protein [Chloroflexota bacterium]